MGALGNVDPMSGGGETSNFNNVFSSHTDTQRFVVMSVEYHHMPPSQDIKEALKLLEVRIRSIDAVFVE